MLFSMFCLCHYIRVYLFAKNIVCLCNKILKLELSLTIKHYVKAKY